MKRAAVYARYSSAGQREESITAQVRAANEYCKKKQYKIILEFIDAAESARSDNRPSFLEMIDAAKNGAFDVLIVHKMDRFARNRYDAAYYKRQLVKANVSIEYVDQPLDGSPESVILESVLEGMAEYYSKNLAREVLKGQRENAYKARYNGGKVLYGYKIVEGKYEIEPSEASAVRRIFSMRAAGAGYNEIMQALSTAGVKTKTGKNFAKNSLFDMLNNQRYIGNYVFGRVATKPDGSRNNHETSPDAIIIPGGQPAIIDQQTWDKVQERIAETRRGPGRHRAIEDYLLSGKIRCTCGAPMTGHRATHKKYGVYTYYRCSDQQRRNECKSKRILKEKAERLTLDVLESQLSPANIPNLVRTINEKLLALAQHHSAEIAALEQRKQAAQAATDNLFTLVEKGQINFDIAGDRIKAQQDILNACNLRLAEIDRVAGQIYLREDQLADMFAGFFEDIKEKRPDKIRALFDAFVESVLVIDPDTVDVTLFLSFEWWRRGGSNP